MKKAVPIVIVVVLVVIIGIVLATRKHSTTNSTASTTTSSSSSNMAGMSQSPNPSSSASPSSGSSSSQSATDKVTISNFAFSPASITVKKGTSVTWTNMDSVAHTVVETDGKAGPNSSNIDHGTSFSFTYNTAGMFAYHCSIHPEMTGTVTVTE